MATNTTNYNLVKPAYTEAADIAVVNGDMDKIDAALTAQSNGYALIANGNTHVQIAQGQYVYVRNHSSLSEGLYRATSTIQANGTLSTSNLTRDSAGELNYIQNEITTLSSNIIHKYIDTSTLLSPLDTTSAFKSFETVGKNVYITFRGESRSHTENEVFLQIPAGYRPGGDRYCVLLVGTSVAIGIMKSNGEVSIWSSSPPSGRIVCMLSYCIE